ncbi:hypothetical protein PVIIG_02756 [Plasmodium vivax India VII]|uniref:Maf-like protein n=2 Tax=Plasmodium vivax TaxID=5855 RepID=A5K6D4_PLAVS|nr:hypothetical protein, conserved [Plasmodium vivax]EDL44875.1 hypothetical protein, conserved [Plasmodium vivax]KMZ81329.1 hypothetical protein PVIIG_02756 [Plasmodium vivax India VII]|eukprot:XP_001614602.1 hypothetical protein [Plasmodium vivax Sal-1]
MSTANGEECKLMHSSPSKKKDLSNGACPAKEKEASKRKQSFNDVELEIDDDIITHLSSRICNKNVTHKILKINNLIDDQMHDYIANGRASEISESNDESDAHEGVERAHLNLRNGYAGCQHGDESSSNTISNDLPERKAISSEQVPTYELNKEVQGKSKAKGKGKGKGELLSDDPHLEEPLAEGHTHFDRIKMMNLLGENTIVYNSRDDQNNVLFLCYDEKSEQCDVCDRYRKNYMSNMHPSSCVPLRGGAAMKGDAAINGNAPINGVAATNGAAAINGTAAIDALSDYFFVLGSTSNSRKYILKQSSLDFLSVRIHIDEKKIGCRKSHDPLTLTANIAVGKGLKLLNMIKTDSELSKQIAELSKGKKVVLLVGDEVIYCNNKIYEKPKNEKEASNFLKSYNNSKCYSYSSITLIELETEKIITGIDESIINVYDMDDSVVKKILDDSSIYFCAGALKIENTHMHRYIKVIKGNIDSIFGLSLNLLFHLVNFL